MNTVNMDNIMKIIRHNAKSWSETCKRIRRFVKPQTPQDMMGFIGCLLSSVILYRADVMDYGSGTGRLYNAIKKFNFKSYTAVDIAEGCLEVFRENEKDERLRFIHSIDGTIDAEDESFDIVLCYSVLTHTSKNRDLETLIINELARTTKVNGLLLISYIDMKERCSGDTNSTDASWLYQYLGKLGFHIFTSVTVPDFSLKQTFIIAKKFTQTI